ncbi:pectin lyase-like protein [Ceratobasidium sp. AG-I]|nr:pectin lyase-like protein [Ceratobasidium sp. AG-I]
MAVTASLATRLLDTTHNGGFGVSTDLTIEDSTISNQDDCLALNRSTNIIFQRNTCTGGHGISIGSVSTGAAVKNVQILNNKIINNDQALRIKTKSDATSASVTGVTFSGNTATGTKKYGIVADQSYPSNCGQQRCDSIAFTGNNNIAVVDAAQRVAVNCGKGTWDWTGLTVTGGKAGKIYNFKGIKTGKY